MRTETEVTSEYAIRGSGPTSAQTRNACGRSASLASRSPDGPASTQALRHVNPVTIPNLVRPDLLTVVAITLRATGAAVVIACLVGVPLGTMLGLIRPALDHVDVLEQFLGDADT